MATHGGLVSAPKLKLAISEAQSDDPRTVTLPNACPGCIVQLDDETAYRAFSVSMHTPNTLPPDQWDLIKLPAEMPKAESADVEVSCEFIIVDKITCGLLDGNDLTTTFGELGRLTSIVMHPPEDCEDATEHWERRAIEMKAAQDEPSATPALPCQLSSPS